jgi:hypothetical protein
MEGHGRSHGSLGVSVIMLTPSKCSMNSLPQDPLLRVQEVLNGTEVNLQHLTALVDCRSLHLVKPLGSWGAGQRGAPRKRWVVLGMLGGVLLPRLM